MKNKIIIVSGFLMLLASIFFYNRLDIIKSISKDEIMFKEEYEKLNKDNKYNRITIPNKNLIKYSSYSEVMNIITSGTGVIYLGFPECPWCRSSLPTLIDSAINTNINEIYYFNALSIRDIKRLEGGKVVTDKVAAKEYYKLVEALKEHLRVYKELDDENIKRIYFPAVIFVKEGQILGVHTGTVESQIDVKIKLSKDQKQELEEIYTIYMYQVLGVLCTDNTEC